MQSEHFLILCVDLATSNKPVKTILVTTMPDTKKNLETLIGKATEFSNLEDNTTPGYPIIEGYVLRVKSYERYIPTIKGFAMITDD